MAVISEALHLFRLEHQGNLKSKELHGANRPATATSFSMINLSEVRDYTCVKVHHLLPQIPLEWSSPYLSLALREVRAEPLQSEDIVIDYLIQRLIDRTLRNIRDIIREDLMGYLAQVTSRDLKKSRKNVYTFLRERFKTFQPGPSSAFNQAEKEVYSMRNELLLTCDIQKLQEEGTSLNKSPWENSELYDTIQGHLILLLQLNGYQFSRIRAEFNFSDLPALLGAHEGMQNVIVEVPPHNIPFFNPPVIQKPKKTDLRPLKEEYVKIIEAAEKKGVLMTPHQAQNQYYVNNFRNLAVYGMGVAFGDPITKAFALGGVLKSVANLVHARGKVLLDISSRRYKELNKALQKLQKTVVQSHQILMSQLAEMEKHQRVMIENQGILHENIESIFKQVQETQKRNLYYFTAVLHDTVLNRLALNTILDGPGLHARDIRNRMVKEKAFSTYFNRFLSYKAFEAFYNREKHAIRQGLTGLPGLFLFPGRNDGAFVIHGSKNSQDHLYLEQYRELHRLHKDAFAGWETRRSLEYLIHPIKDVEEVDKLKSYFSSKELPPLPDWMKESLDLRSLDALLGLPYDFEKVVDYSASAHAFHYFYEFMENEPGGPLVSLENIESSHSSQGLNLLKNAFLRTTIAIAQANILMGNHLLPSLYALINDKNKRTETLNLISSNIFLSQNLMIYSFRKKMEDQKRPLTDYYLPYHYPENSSPLETLLGSQWNFTWDKDKKFWGVKPSEKAHVIPLPSPKELLQGSLALHPQLASLLHTRQLLLREMASYQPTRGEGPTYDSYKLGILLTSIYFRNILNPSGGKHVNTDQYRASL